MHLHFGSHIIEPSELAYIAQHKFVRNSTLEPSKIGHHFLKKLCTMSFYKLNTSELISYKLISPGFFKNTVLFAKIAL